MNNELIKRNLETMLLNSKGLRKGTLEIILSLIEDYEDYRTLFDDIIYQGCISGIIPHLIYYSDTEKFFDKYSNEIFELYNDFNEETGYTLSTIDKNSLAWFSYELIVSNLYDEIVEHEDLFAAYR